MNDKQVALVQASWAQVEPIADTAAALFYGRLFDVAPGVRPMFADDITEQGAKLMAMIGTVVEGLDRLDEIAGAVRGLGERHAGYGAEPAHYDVVGATLLWTLGQGLGERFTPEVEEAWAEAYGILADTMLQAADHVGV